MYQTIFSSNICKCKYIYMYIYIIFFLSYYMIFFKFACVKWETVEANIQFDFHLLHSSLQCPQGVTHLLIQLKKVVSLFIAKTFPINMSVIPGIDFSQRLSFVWGFCLAKTLPTGQQLGSGMWINEDSRLIATQLNLIMTGTERITYQ